MELLVLSVAYGSFSVGQPGEALVACRHPTPGRGTAARRARRRCTGPAAGSRCRAAPPHPRWRRTASSSSSAFGSAEAVVVRRTTASPTGLTVSDPISAAEVLVRRGRVVAPHDAGIERAVLVAGHHGRPVGRVHGDLDADVGEVLRDDVRHRQPVGGGGADRDLERERLAVRGRALAVCAGLDSRQRRASRRRSSRRASSRCTSRRSTASARCVRAGQAGAVGRIGVARHADLDDLLAVDRHAQRLAHVRALEQGPWWC